jgi:hypothetical protein
MNRYLQCVLTTFIFSLSCSSFGMSMADAHYGETHVPHAPTNDEKLVSYASQGNTAMVQRLLTPAGLDRLDLYFNPLHIHAVKEALLVALQGGHLEIVNLLLMPTISNGGDLFEIIAFAASYDSPSIIARLLLNPEIRACAISRAMPLLLAIEGYAYADAQQAERRLSIITQLLAAGAPVNTMDGDQDITTPLHLAASLPRCESIVEQLLAKDGNVYTVDKDGRTPLHARRGWLQEADANNIDQICECMAAPLLEDSLPK